jgi:hypothetical protein
MESICCSCNWDERRRLELDDGMREEGVVQVAVASCEVPSGTPQRPSSGVGVEGGGRKAGGGGDGGGSFHQQLAVQQDFLFAGGHDA